MNTQSHISVQDRVEICRRIANEQWDRFLRKWVAIDVRHERIVDGDDDYASLVDRLSRSALQGEYFVAEGRATRSAKLPR